MNEPTAVVLPKTLKWPRDALGEHALLAFEVYDPTHLPLEDRSPVDVPAWLLERGFERLVEEAWSFPYLEGHVLGVFADLGDIALIEGGDLFSYPLAGLPAPWREHLMRERSCLLITGVDLRLATHGMGGIEDAVCRGDAYAGMVLINEGLD